MARTDIGRAVPLLKGEYSPTTTYELNDIVSLNGSLYWHYSHEETTNVAPQATSTWKVVLSLADAEAYIARAETAAETAEDAAEIATAAKTAAESASTTATGASATATAAKNDALTAKTAAETAQAGAVTAKTAAETARDAAQASATAAGTSATNAGNSAGTAEYYAGIATTAGETASEKATEATGAATTATSAAATATSAKDTAVSSASTASTAATTATSAATAAQAVKDSIPEDYSQLSADVGDLKTQLNTNNDGLYNSLFNNLNTSIPLNSSLYEKGSIGSSGADSEYGADSRARNKSVEYAYQNIIFDIESGYSASAAFYTSYKISDWSSSTDWVNTLVVPAGSYYRILIRENSATTTDLATLLSKVTYRVQSKSLDSIDFSVKSLTLDNSILSSDFEKGSMNGTGQNSTVNAASRARNKTVQYTISKLTFYIKTGFSATYAAYSSYDVTTYTGGGSWTTKLEIPAGTYYRLLIRNDTTAETALETLLDAVTMNVESKILDTIKNTGLNSELFEKGSIGPTGADSSYNASSRARNKTVQYTYTEITFYPAVGFSIGAAFYANSDVSSWTTGLGLSKKITIPAGSYYRLLIVNDFTIESELSTLVSAITITSTLPIIETIYNSFKEKTRTSITPNIIIASKDSMVRRDLPPNSKYAIKAVAHNQYDKVRFSVTKTTDGYYVAVHDTTINNLVTNPDGTAVGETIYTADCSLEELNEYDWGLKYGEQYQGLQVPMLEDCISLATKYNLTIGIDFKWNPNSTDIDNIFALLAKYGQTNAYITGISYSVCALFKAKSPKLSYVVGGDSSDLETHLEDCKGLLTGYNKVYWIVTPLGTAPSSTEYITTASNNIDLQYQPVENIATLTSVVFDHGINFIECRYLENVKDLIMAYADSLVQ